MKVRKTPLFLVFAAAAAFAAKLEIVSPKYGETVPLLSEGQKAYLDMPREERRAKFADKAFRHEMRDLGYYPQGVTLAWKWTSDTGAAPVFTVEVSRLPDGLPVFRADTVGDSVTVDNLEIARDYRFSLYVRELGAVVASRHVTFSTEDRAPRLIRVPGVPNVRDLGGRIGRGGRRVRQGAIIRTAGLNDNASDVYYTREEVLALDKDGAVAAREKKLVADIERYSALAADTNLVTVLPVAVSRDWTLFLPDATNETELAAAVAGLDSIPESLLGGVGGKVTADENGRCALAAFAAEDAHTRLAVFMQTVESASDGEILLGCGADWWWRLYANGELAIDRSIPAGNRRASKTVNDWIVPVTLRKGTNVLAFVVRAGSVGLSMSCVTLDSLPNSEVFSRLVKDRADETNDLFRVKSGMIPGAARLDDASRAWMLNTLGVRTDIDLRSDGECYGMTGSPLGETVAWRHISSAAYGGMQNAWGREQFTKVFRVFLDPAAYPVDFHCIAGQDRTGAVAFILNALLGVSEEELYLDWEATGFWNPDPGLNHADRFDHLVEAFMDFPGATINDKVEAYVLDLGFTREEIGRFRELMLEPYPAAIR